MTTLVAGAAVAAATALFADPAAGAGSAPTGARFCARGGTLTLANWSGIAPTLSHPGEYGSVPVTLRNASHAAVTDARLSLSVSADHGRRPAAPPALRWRLAGGPWHRVALHKTSDRGYASDPMGLPRIAAGSTHTLRLAAAFRSGSPAGSYTVRAALRAGHCASLLGLARASYVFAPSPGRSPSPTSSHKPGKPSGAAVPQPAPSAAGHSPGGTGAAIPGVRPAPPSGATSPVPMPGATTLGGGPVAPIPTGAAVDRALTDPIAGANRDALIIGGVGSLFVGASVAALVYLRRRRVS